MGACGSSQVEKARRARNTLQGERSQDQSAVLRQVRRKGTALEFASEELRGNWWVVAEAVAQDGYALRYASAELQTDKVLVMLALETCGRALCFASSDVRGDETVVMEAVKQHGDALQFAASELKSRRLAGATLWRVTSYELIGHPS